MRGARFDSGEVEAERRVIVEERARELASPQGRLDQTHLAMTYLRHPYRNPILGWPEDIARISADDLRAFYKAHYRPDEAVLVVVGDLEPGAALDRIASEFADVPAGQSPRFRPAIVEPDQSGRRGFVVAEPESAAGVCGLAHGPPAHRDVPILDVLPIYFAAVGDRVSGSRWSRPTRSPRGSRPPIRGAPRRTVLHPTRGRSQRRVADVEQRIATRVVRAG